MLNKLAASELVLNPDGSVYHLNLQPEDIAEKILLVGDPDRVPKVSQYFDTIEIQKNKREFYTHTGTLRGERITVMSTGIGTENIDIVMNELDALVNIDLKEKEFKSEHTALQLFRLGTCGSVNPDVEVDNMLVSQNVVGLDGLMHFYQDYEFENENACVYLIKCYNETEVFFKIGITTKEVSRRFAGFSSMPYDFPFFPFARRFYFYPNF